MLLGFGVGEYLIDVVRDRFGRVASVAHEVALIDTRPQQLFGQGKTLWKRNTAGRTPVSLHRVYVAIN